MPDVFLYNSEPKINDVRLRDPLSPNGAINVLAGIGLLFFTGFAPTLSISNNISVTTGLGSVVITGMVPVVNAGNNISVTTGLGSVVITGMVPVVNIFTIVYKPILKKSNIINNLKEESNISKSVTRKSFVNELI